MASPSRSHRSAITGLPRPASPEVAQLPSRLRARAPISGRVQEPPARQAAPGRLKMAPQAFETMESAAEKAPAVIRTVRLEEGPILGGLSRARAAPFPVGREEGASGWAVTDSAPQQRNDVVDHRELAALAERPRPHPTRLPPSYQAEG